MSTLNYSLNQLTDSKTYTHIQLPIKNDSPNGKIGLIQDIDFGVMEGFGYVTDGNNESSRIDNFVSFVTTVDLLFKNLNTRITDLKRTVDKLASTSFIASITTTPTAMQPLKYDGTSKVLITAGSASNGVMYYSLTNEGPYSTSLPQRIDAGTYTVFYYAKGNEGYNDSATSQLNVTIAKASSLNTVPTIISQTIPHDGTSHNLINAGVANNGTMEYGVNNSSTTPPTSWSANIPQGTDSGTYHIWYRITNGVDSNHEPTNATYIGSVTIAQRIIEVTGISLDQESLSINADAPGTLIANVLPPEAANKTINWSSNKIEVATVTESTTSGHPATVTWKKEGTCIITATAAGNTNANKTCRVTCQKAPNNCYIGVAQDLTFTESDLNKYVAVKPEIIELPVGTVDDVTVWIYPQSWGKPKKANPIIDGSVDESKDHRPAFRYSGFKSLPEGCLGCNIALDSTTTYKLTW